MPMYVTVRSIGPYRIASSLRDAGYDVEVIDYAYFWDPVEILSYIDKGPKPLWIGFSTTFSDYSISGNVVYNKLTRFGSKDQWFFDECKKRAPIVVGGARVNYLKNFYDIDWCLTGYGDIAVTELSDFLSNKKTDLLFTEEKNNNNYSVKTIDCQKSYPVTDVSKIQTKFVDTDFIFPGEVLPLEISRGCIFSCAFCAYPLNGKKKNDYVRPIEQIKDDIITYQTKYKSNVYMFVDDTFNDTVEKMQMIADIKESVDPFVFWAYGRLDLLAANPKMIELLEKCGWKYLDLGLETLSKTAGSMVGKGADPKKQIDALRKIKNTYPDSWILLELITGLPGESASDLLSNFNTLIKNPTLWDELNYKELTIPKIQFFSWSSKMTKNPEKFGIELLKNDSNSVVSNWKTNNMTSQDATSLNNKIRNSLKSLLPKLPSSVPNRSKTNRYYYDMTGLSFEELKANYNLLVEDFFADRFYLYKEQKLSTRKLLPICKKQMKDLVIT